MKIIEKVKKLFRKGTNLVLEEIEIHKKYDELKSELLKSQPITELKNICKEFELKITEKALFKVHIQENLNLEQLIEYFQKKKIDIKKVLKQKEQIDTQYNHHPLISNKLETDKFELKVNI